MMYKEIIQEAQQLKQQQPELRFGQAVFNITYDKHPEVVRKYAGSRIDPFYNDSVVGDFLEIIEMQVGG